MPVLTLTKQPAEDRLFVMDFSPLLGSGETLAGVTSVTADVSGLTIGSPAYSGVFATVRISGGTDGVRYKVTFLATTSDSNTVEAEGILQVKDL